MLGRRTHDLGGGPARFSRRRRCLRCRAHSRLRRLRSRGPRCSRIRSIALLGPAARLRRLRRRRRSSGLRWRRSASASFTLVALVRCGTLLRCPALLGRSALLRRSRNGRSSGLRRRRRRRGRRLCLLGLPAALFCFRALLGRGRCRRRRFGSPARFFLARRFDVATLLRRSRRRCRRRRCIRRGVCNSARRALAVLLFPARLSGL